MVKYLKSSFNFFKKAFFVIAVYFIVISLFSFFINKDKISIKTQADPIKTNREEIYKTINDKKLASTKEGKVAISLYRIMMCSMIGEACTNNPNDGDKNFSKSISGLFTKIITFPMANPPASGIYWVSSGLKSAGFIPKTYAAEGIGFAAIKPYANIWKIFRDLSYMLLVLVLISIGFMVMFRAKINAQTVISVENALPKIVISLILITFSFAIAGFLIDLTYIIIGLIVSILSVNPSGGTYYNSTEFTNGYLLSGPWDLIVRDIRVHFGWRSIGESLGASFIQIMPVSASIMLRTIAGGLAIPLTNWLILFITGEGASLLGLSNLAGATFSIGNVLKGFFSLTLFPLVITFIFLLGYIYLLPLIVSILISASILFLAIRIFTTLFSNYLKLIVLIMLGPFLLLFEAVPGRSAFKYWIMNIVGNLITYPIMILVFVLSYILVWHTNASDLAVTLPYLNGIDSNSFRFMIALGLIFLIPDFIKTAKEAIGIKDIPFSVGLGTYFGGVGTAAGGGVGLLGQIGSINLGLSALIGDTPLKKLGGSMMGFLNRNKEKK